MTGTGGSESGWRWWRCCPILHKTIHSLSIWAFDDVICPFEDLSGIIKEIIGKVLKGSI